jgi:Resolvase, N terminal domain
VRRYWDDHPGCRLTAVSASRSPRGDRQAIDTTTLGGKLLFQVFAALAEFERDLIRETHHRPAAGRW